MEWNVAVEGSEDYCESTIKAHLDYHIRSGNLTFDINNLELKRHENITRGVFTVEDGDRYVEIMEERKKWIL